MKHLVCPMGQRLVCVDYVMLFVFLFSNELHNDSMNCFDAGAGGWDRLLVESKVSMLKSSVIGSNHYQGIRMPREWIGATYQPNISTEDKFVCCFCVEYQWL